MEINPELFVHIRFI